MQSQDDLTDDYEIAPFSFSSPHLPPLTPFIEHLMRFDDLLQRRPVRVDFSGRRLWHVLANEPIYYYYNSSEPRCPPSIDASPNRHRLRRSPAFEHLSELVTPEEFDELLQQQQTSPNLNPQKRIPYHFQITGPMAFPTADYR